MWMVIVGVFGLGLGILALIGLLAVAKELFCAGSLDANLADDGAAGRHDVRSRASTRCATTR
jgi:hypothetical protein